MALDKARSLLGLVAGISISFAAFACATYSGKEKTPPPPKERVSEPVKEVVPTTQPSALQRTLAEIEPAAIAAPGRMQKRLDRAVDSYLQRIQTSRIYVALDKPIYQPGETIWFRSWEVGTSDLMPATRSGQGMTFHLVSPKGAVVLQKRVAIAEGVARNTFELPAGVPGGEYTIRVMSDTGSRFERGVIISSYQPPRIKKKLEFVRKAYGPGDHVAAALALHRATGEPLSAGTVTAIAEVDRQEVARVPIAMTAKGTALVKFDLPGHIARGDGLLTVLVEDGGVTESIQKRIPITLDKIKFALFPEGGDLVRGLPGRVYFSAQTLIDKPADVQGRVVDDRGEMVAELASLHDGMGRFEITPEKGRSYRVHITRPVGIAQTFPLPEARDEGCSMQAVDDFDSQRDGVRIGVWCTAPRSIIATASLRERKIGTETVDVKPGEPTIVELPAPRWNQGAVRVTVFSDRGAPLAERLIYRGRGADMKVKVEPDRKSYSPRDRVALTIETTDLAGKPVPADLSLAVVDDTVLSFADDETANILAKLYLEHELQGQKIEKPNFYFSDDPKAAASLDLLLGTLGWRRFEWKLILSPDYGADVDGDKWNEKEGYHAAVLPGRSKRTASAGRRGRTLRVLRRLAEPAAGADYANAAPGGAAAALLAQPAATGTLNGRVADEDGKPLSGVRVIAQSTGTGRTSAAVTDGAGRYSIGGLQPGMYVVTFAYRGVAIRRQVSIRMGRSTMLNGRLDTSAIVPEATTAAASEAKPEGRAAKMRRPARRPMPKPAEEPMAAPVAAEPMPADEAERELGPMVDGIVADQPVMGRLRANVAKDKAALEDLDWAGDDAKQGAGQALAWAVVREFPAPRYETRYDGPRTDFRETIYWAPVVHTDENGKATAEFFLSDAVTSFRATVEGVSQAGRPGRAEALLESKLPVSLVAKLPLEVSAGDRIELPVTLSNETTYPLAAKMNAVFGPAFKVVHGAPDRVTLGAKASKSFFYTLEVVGNGREESDGRVALSVEAANLRDEVERVIDVVPLGFPQEVSVAGTVADSARHEVDLAGALPGTIKAELSMYPSPLATMTKGTEAIIREPYGCFEQASSANYPNVMVLSYLEENDAADPDLVAKTNAMLERGYRMLTGYESPKHGYEWFGGDPGHEALTAYGLMEFADMARVFDDTDRTMVRRTAAWLASRRDGKGGYKRNSRALDSFGRASEEVTNGYITWALSEAGAKDLQTELAYQQRVAKDTKDPYLMALAAGTMVNLDPGSKTTRAALDKLSTMRGGKGDYSGANHSITRSGGIALQIETTSLAVLALLKAGAGYLNEVRPSIEWLDGQRSGYGGYGSTQSTVLALKAMTRYAEASRVTRSSGVASLFINGEQVKKVSFEAGHKDALEFGDVGASLKPGKNQIEVRLDSESPLPYSMAISYRSKLPASSKETKVALSTHLASSKVAWGEGIRMHVTVRNLTDEGIPMTLARVGLPGGLTFQTWQLKELREKKLIDFYETNDREVILYFRSLGPEVEKQLDLDLMAAVPGTYVAPASSAYLYYTDEYKHWAEPLRVTVARK